MEGNFFSLITYTNTSHELYAFQNYSLTAGVTRTLSNNWTSRFNAALLSRSPEVNELHSFGLHQGVAGIEEGDPSLLPETSIKGLWTHQFGKAGRFLAEATAYAQFVHNYIFLEPQDEFRLTIRGAFPVFLYRQTDATLSGFDLQVKWEPYDKWELSAKYATVRGWDHKGDLPLVFMPADNISASASHFLKDGKLFSDTRIGLNSTPVFQQNRLEPGQDFLAPPPAFWLLGADIETRIFLKTSDLVLTLQAENILNLSYRSYLNRLRYYADDVGRNIRLIVRWGF